MREREHLTKNQIAGYRAGGFDALERREIGRHLLKCESCRRSLSAPTFDDFWNAVMTERETEQSPASEESDILPRFGFSLSKIFGSFGGLAWSGAALVVLCIFSLMFWLSLGKESNQEREVAQTFNSEKTDFNTTQLKTGEQNLSRPTQNTESDKQVFSPESNHLPANSKIPSASGRQNNPNLSAREDVSRNSAVRPYKDNQPKTISSTRGGVLPADCGGEMPVETETGLSGEAVTLKWKKFPNAVKYHLYVSDDEEILIDEYETERETSYTVKKSLDAAKTYNWKVVITTEDGKTIVGDSQKFTIKSLQFNRNKTEKKEKQQVRCTQTN